MALGSHSPLLARMIGVDLQNGRGQQIELLLLRLSQSPQPSPGPASARRTVAGPMWV
jgi:hypothetical protein